MKRLGRWWVGGCGAVALSAACSMAQTTIWLEGEAPSSGTLPHKTNGWGNAHYLSGEAWLHTSLAAEAVEKEIPAEGAFLKYEFATTEPGRYEVWNRLGFEFVRTPFTWRVDDGPWQSNEPARDFTVDVMEIANWCEVAWARLGEVELTPGQHRLELRFERQFKDADRKQPERLIYASDALLLHRGTFRPNGRHKPDDAWRSEADRRAETQRFELPPPAEAGLRTELPLAGDWQYARWDEPGPVEDRTGPIKALPPAEELHWSSIPVPGDRNKHRPDQLFAHRYFYRTRVFVPAEYAGGSFVLRFTQNNLLTTVFVNGQRVAFSDACAMGFHADLTAALRPGEVNELWVGIKDPYYAIAPNAEKSDLRRWFNTPLSLLGSNQGVTMRFEFPTRNTLFTGIVGPVTLVATGPVYADDVYVIPSVSKKELTVEVTLRNPGAAARTVEVGASVRPHRGDGGSVLTLPPITVAVPAGGEALAVLRAPWKDAQLWWPDEPFLYDCVSTARLDGKPADTQVTRFGFREWSIEGTRFALNGVPWQMRAALDFLGASEGEGEKAVAHWRKTGQTMFRLMHQFQWAGLSRLDTLRFMDEQGVPVRVSPGWFDGQHASYGLVEQRGDGDGKGKKEKVARTTLFDNVRKQFAAGMRQVRNHPCVFVWMLDNEIIFINTRNFGNLEAVEPEFKKTSEMVLSMDRQGRGTMTGGGRALMDQSLPINGCHYETSELRNYPDAAYGLDWAAQDNKQPWPMALDKPIFLGEEYFANGNQPGWFAEVCGERCFLGSTATRDAASLIARMYSEGFRWQELAAFHFWFGSSSATPDYWQAWQPVLVLVREWNRTLRADGQAQRTVMLRNDTRFADPIEFEWTWTVGGKQIGGAREEHAIAPGQGKVLTLTLPTPPVTGRTPATLELVCRRGGKELFRDVKAMGVLAPEARPSGADPAVKIAVWDPEGSSARRLQARGWTVLPVEGLDKLPADFDLLVVGRDALGARDATDPRWVELAEAGRKVLVLEQRHPLHYQAVPADLEPTTNAGRVAFSQNAGHPVFRDLEASDLAFWGKDHVVYRAAYEKASNGGQSLVQCGSFLRQSALTECPVADGLLLLSQLAVVEKLEEEPVAAMLFDNLVAHALAYRPVRKDTVVVLPDGPRLALLRASGLAFATAGTLREALERAGDGIVVCDGSPAAMKELADMPEAVAAHTARGGWIMPWNVGPEALAAFNRLVGVEHVIRPFRREKVQLPPVRDPLISGLSQSDMTLYSGERIFDWLSDRYVADDTFTHVVDLDEVGPFLNGPHIEGTASVVNGMVGTDKWKYIVYLPIEEGADALPSVAWTLPRRETLTNFGIVPNGHYQGIRRFALVFDGREAEAQVFSLEPFTKDDCPRQDFALAPVEAESVTFKVLEVAQVGGDKPITGIDNLWLTARRTAEWRERVVGLLGSGALVKYPRGAGGILLNQLRIKDSEEVPENAGKKQAVLATLLRNLGAQFASARTLRPGAGLAYEPVSFEGVANLYLEAARGWPLKEQDLGTLPLDRQRLGGVLFEIRDFKTSPLESAVTLQGLPGVRAPREVAIPVGRKADALFFLHTAAVRNQWQPRRERDKPPVMWQYVVHYADGGTATVDVVWGRHAAHYLQNEEPEGLVGAALAWSAPAPNAPGKHLAVHHLQWSNPRPDQVIARIVLQYGEPGNRWASPVLLGLTGAVNGER